ncbi:MAG: ATP/GTP-binding protein [Candidatus Poribacteria bacterium]
MYKSFKIRNFRCFQELVMEPLGRVNLIAGPNNVGKTALLEALFLHCGPTNPDLPRRVNLFRGIEPLSTEADSLWEPLWSSLFYKFDDSATIELWGEEVDGKQRTLRLSLVYQQTSQVKIHENMKESTTRETSSLSIEALGKSLKLEYNDGSREAKVMNAIIEPQGIRIGPYSPPPFPGIFLLARRRVNSSEDAERFGKLEIAGKQDIVLKFLKLIEPRLRRLAVIVSAGVPTIHGDIGLGRLLPLPLMGGGMGRLSSLILAIANAPDGIVLVDEIENGIHHSVMDDVWKAIAKSAQDFNVQIFAATHSEECIRAAHEAFEECNSYDFRLHRLEFIDDSIRAITYDQETLDAAIEVGLEVR